MHYTSRPIARAKISALLTSDASRIELYRTPLQLAVPIPESTEETCAFVHVSLRVYMCKRLNV